MAPTTGIANGVKSRDLISQVHDSFIMQTALCIPLPGICLVYSTAQL